MPRRPRQHLDKEPGLRPGERLAPGLPGRALAALLLSPMATPDSAAGETTVPARAAIDCPPGYVCIYPDIDFGGQPWMGRASDGSVKDLPSAIRDRGSAVTDACFRLGLHLNIVQFPGSSSILRLAPPLTITDAELDRGLDILDQALTAAAKA
ncbi:peptidase inhibitor family I36 protein [Streptomyces sp. NPDC053750]|uniref:peptidase inhibitor family I36 protein n=1 Tax=Streptomyces sp. NPDC053750 TaxID=3365714 RepID=UPI0037D8109F